MRNDLEVPFFVTEAFPTKQHYFEIMLFFFSLPEKKKYHLRHWGKKTDLKQEIPTPGEEKE